MYCWHKPAKHWQHIIWTHERLCRKTNHKENSYLRGKCDDFILRVTFKKIKNESRGARPVHTQLSTALDSGLFPSVWVRRMGLCGWEMKHLTGADPRLWASWHSRCFSTDCCWLFSRRWPNVGTHKLSKQDRYPFNVFAQPTQNYYFGKIRSLIKKSRGRRPISYCP